MIGLGIQGLEGDVDPAASVPGVEGLCLFESECETSPGPVFALGEGQAGGVEFVQSGQRIGDRVCDDLTDGPPIGRRHLLFGDAECADSAHLPLIGRQGPGQDVQKG